MVTAVSLSRTQARLAGWQRASGTSHVVASLTVFSLIVSVGVCYSVLLLVNGSFEQVMANVGLSGFLLPVVVPLLIAPMVTIQLTAALTVASTVIEELEESHRELERMANHDPMTNLLNRRGFFGAIAELESTRLSTLVIATADIDKFKSVNDTYGHAAGDVVLIRVAEALRAAAGTTAIVGRLGGDEFVAGLPEGRNNVEIIRQVLSAVVIPEVAETGLEVRCSVGVAVHELGAGIDETMANADVALYQDKHGDTKRHRPVFRSIARP